MTEFITTLPRSGPVEISGTTEQQCALFAAASKAHGEMNLAKKDAANPHFKSKYADLASVIDTSRKALSENGLVVFQLPESTSSEVGVKTILAHKDGATLTASFHLPMSGGGNVAHAAGSLLTYIRRYARQAILDMAADDDDGCSAPTTEPFDATVWERKIDNMTLDSLSTVQGELQGASGRWPIAEKDRLVERFRKKGGELRAAASRPATPEVEHEPA